MKNKGAVNFFAIFLAIISLFHLSFTLKTYLVEKNAKEAVNYDNTDLPQEYRDSLLKVYKDSIRYKDVYNILVKKYNYEEIKQREINLGLDLQGGMHVTLEVAMDDLLRELSNYSKDPQFQKIINRAKEMQKGGQEDFITYFIKAHREIIPDKDLNTYFSTLDNKGQVDHKTSDEDVIRFLRENAESSLNSAFDVLKRRIDKFGVAQPNIQLLEGSGRIVVELPGVDDPERIKYYLQSTAKLEFWETYENKEIIPLFEEVNKYLVSYLGLNDEKKSTADSTSKDKETLDFLETDNDTNQVAEEKDESSLEFLADENDTTKVAADSTLAEDDSTKTEQFDINDFPLYQVLTPYIGTNEQGGQYFVDGPIIGTAFVNDTPKVNKYLNLPQVKALLLDDVKFAWTANAQQTDNGPAVQLIALKITTYDQTAPLDGKAVTRALVNISPLGEREITLRMNNEGAETWGNLTEKNIGHSIAIVLDGLVYSFPTVQSAIKNGNSSISGGFTAREATDLANILNAGKLDVRINVIEEAVVGPSLGEESIQQGLISLLVGLILVLLFMVFYYNKSGFVANLALLANLFFIIGVLSSLGAALTLPGMAGIVLTIGMSVDANVLIFERIREEIANGKGLKLAIKEGYLKAYSSIIDANVTTLLVGIVLFKFGEGPVHGFATILIIGILTSLFSAILITRVIFDTQLKKEKDILFGSKLTNNVFNNLSFDFLSKRKVAYAISGIIIIGGLASLFTQGLEQGVDFKGGYSFTVRFDKDVNTTELSTRLSEPLQGQPDVKTFGPSNQVLITTAFMIDDPSKEADSIVKSVLNKNLTDYNPNFEIVRSQKVNPTIADDILKSGRNSLIVALILIFFYIFIRFRKWQYGVAAVLTLFHDVLIILSIFSIFRNIMPFSLEVDQSFIAALLTVIGYSINDTVVVFDRIREKLGSIRSKSFNKTVNNALNETLSRTVITSFTTLIVILILFIFGGEIIRGFSFALLIGIIVGTYSSIFVSTPIVVEFWKKEQKNEESK